MVTATAESHLQNASRLRALLYVALVFSAVVALFGIDEIQARVLEQHLAPEWRLVPAVVFGGTLLLYAVDRVLLVRAGKFPSGRAFFQVAFGLVLITLLLPPGLRDYETGRSAHAGSDAALALMKHADPRVRALAAEVAGHRGEQAHLVQLVALLRDESPVVRSAALAALERRTGTTLGTLPDAAGAWEQHVAARGVAAPPGGAP